VCHSSVYRAKLEVEAMKAEMKAEALKRMKLLQMQETTMKEFMVHDIVKVSENGILFKMNDEQSRMIKEWEDKTGHVVYHVIHSLSNFGELYDLLFVSKFMDDWATEATYIKQGIVFAYDVNVDCPDCSEIGSIAVQAYRNGLIRVG
jgi:hypothetical protein